METEANNHPIPDTRVHMNIAYLLVVFTIFTLLITLTPELLKEDAFLSVQIVLAIPLLFSSIFARSRSVYVGKDTRLWKTYGFLCFLIAYTFLVNSVGILLAVFSSSGIVLIFFIANLILSSTYSFLEVRERREKMKERLWKDTIFIAIIIFLGLLPALGVY
ncbi:MAG: hypothetical protein AAB632_01110 [Patescibacteria group bacterium]